MNTVAIDGHGTVGTHARLAAGGVGVGTAALFSGSIVVDHAVDYAGGNQKTQLWSAKKAKSIRSMVFGQTEQGDAVARALQHSADDGVAEGWVIDIGFANDVHKIRRVPAAPPDILGGDGKKIHSGTSVVHS